MHLFSKTKSLFKLTVCAVSLVLFGCSPSASDINKTYAERLNNVLAFKEFELTKPARIEPVHFDIVSGSVHTIGMLELAQLRQCELATLIAEHNNQLGKTATAAGVLSYQIDFIQAAEKCLDTLSPDNPLYTKIAQASEQKQQTLPQYFEAMITNEREFKVIWQLTSSNLDEHTAGFTETEHAMSMFAMLNEQIKTGDISKIDTASLINALEVLNKFKYNTLLVSAVRTQIHYNEQLTTLLQQYEIDALCPANKNKQKAQKLSNIFKKFYLEQLQPYQSFLTGKLESLLPLYEKIWQDPTLGHYVDSSHEGNILTELKFSAKQHVTWWQNFYKQCEISPL